VRRRGHGSLHRRHARLRRAQRATCTGGASDDDVETCNGTDDDCDGQIDDGTLASTNACGGVCVLADAPGATCDGPDGDACSDDAFDCAGLNAMVCTNAAPDEDVELCDGADNDCDGFTDEASATFDNGCGGLHRGGGCPAACDSNFDPDLCTDDTWECLDLNNVSAAA
jgi:hypothetical protein